MTHVITIANQKGGVGKTTTAINLASCVGLAEYRCLLIDMDPQANASSGLGEGRDSEVSIFQPLLDHNRARDSIIRRPGRCLDLAPSHIALANLEQGLADARDRELRLAHALEDIRDDYDFVFVDCPPSLGILTHNALTASNSVIIPVQCEYFAMEGLSRIINAIQRVRNRHNPSLAIEGIAFTMYQRGVQFAQDVVDEVADYFPHEVYNAKIVRDSALAEAPSHGKSILEYDIRSLGARSYLELAKEVIERVNNKEAGTRAGIPTLTGTGRDK